MLLFILYHLESSKIAKHHELYESQPLLDGFAWEVKVSCDIGWMFRRFSGSSMHMFISSGVRLAYSGCKKLTSLKSVPCVISSMTVLKVSATPGIVTTKIGSWVDISAGCQCDRVVCISKWRRGTEFGLWSWYHSHSSLTMPGCHCVPKSPTLQRYSPMKWTVATPLQLSQSPNCKALLLQLRWRSCQDPFHLPSVLLAYHNPKPISSRWTIMPKPGVPGN